MGSQAQMPPQGGQQMQRAVTAGGGQINPYAFTAMGGGATAPGTGGMGATATAPGAQYGGGGIYGGAGGGLFAEGQRLQDAAKAGVPGAMEEYRRHFEAQRGRDLDPGFSGRPGMGVTAQVPAASYGGGGVPTGTVGGQPVGSGAPNWTNPKYWSGGDSAGWLADLYAARNAPPGGMGVTAQAPRYGRSMVGATPAIDMNDPAAVREAMSRPMTGGMGLGSASGIGGSFAPSSTAPMTVAPAPGMTGAIGGPGGPAVPGGNTSTAGQPAPPPFPGAPPPQGDPFSRPTSAMDVYRSSVPVMQDAMKTAVGGAMADAGFSGNRFGSYAMDRAAQEGSRAGLQQNQLLTNLLHDQTNRDLDRSLQASNIGLQHGTAANQMQLDRMRFLADQGRYEQDRQDRYGMLPYQDFEQNKLGFLPLLMQMAQSPGTATAPTFATQQTGGSPGAFDYLTLLANLYGAYQSGQ